MKKHPEDAPFRQSPEDNCRFTFIDLFAGIGGIRLPFQQQGGRCVFTSEWDKFAQRTYFANFGEMPDGDITRIAAKDIPDHDILLGGFPCQAFSQAGARQGFNDTRGTMFFEVQRIMTEKRPKAFLLENVKQLRGHDGGRTLQTILDILRGQYEQTVPDNIPLSEETRSALSQKLNYWVDFRVLRAADFGIPQNRERIFIIGFDRDQFPDADFDTLFSWPEPTHQPTCLGDILQSKKALAEDAVRYKKDRFTISDKLWAGHQKRKREHKARGNGFGYCLFNKNSEYTNTLSARYYKDGSEILIDQSRDGRNPRKLTPRECANLQGFPENYITDAVSQGQIYKQFGNSVCMTVVEAIAEQLTAALVRAGAIPPVK
ncbi:DNA (cytosine-5-)-methyltransferase [Morganella morganii]|uniref:Cytosine-specific methyltransferase n=1 Tax=Morganella morganii TaxID=582 RepID=A0A8I0PXV9_MORMO|nr:DNA cytosine methyltransferase [Morganella morganii]OFU96024.1 DNA cytosine methyltransferase [Morganella sp. HMSC11D09]MBE8613322.1 DNA cytosine methyltransferase [Morganella morganii]MBT0329441.1 DNA cytosine methyltransferase [Morganella morganii subsp. morganii]MBT0417681.1 DNA cytosine methyltransferase [Morganella morganii subsp. morganii]OQP26090.1 DNA (cytosine-5-)-methyltransferase [Morganella morganii]